jgi:uncharacterized protein DUF1566
MLPSPSTVVGGGTMLAWLGNRIRIRSLKALGPFIVIGLAIAGCEVVAPVRPVPRDAAAEQGNQTGRPHGNCGPIWAEWPVPNPARFTDGSPTGLPNPASYDMSRPDVIIDRITNLVWQRAVPAESGEWAGAEAYCAALELDGHDDWRLPTRIELVSLVNFAAGAIDRTIFVDTPEGNFWSCSPLAGNQLHAWVVDFTRGSGATFSNDLEHQNYTRCVRSDATPVSTPRYSVSDAGTVRDERTGLVWDRATKPTIGTWGDAFVYCDDLVRADKSDWRLPTLTELQSLIDETRMGPAVDTSAFPNFPANHTWTSSRANDNDSLYWFVGTASGNTSYYAVSEFWDARCVR